MALQWYNGLHAQVPLLHRTTAGPTHTSLSTSAWTSDTLSGEQGAESSWQQSAKASGSDIYWGSQNANNLQDQDFGIVSIDVSVVEEALKKDEDMGQVKTKATIGLLATLISYVSLNSLYRAISPNAFSSYAEDREDVAWRASSKSWWDQKACRWLSICGGGHVEWTGEYFGDHVHQPSHDSTVKDGDWDWQSAWSEKPDKKQDFNFTLNATLSDQIPEYVIEYAPLVHLFSKEQFWPCDMAEHLFHTTPSLNYTPIQDETPTLNNLYELNRWEHARWVFLMSKDNVEERPEWLEGVKNIPAVNTTTEKVQDNDGWVHRPGRTHLQALKDAAKDLKDWYGAGNHTWDNTVAFKESTSAQAAHDMHLEATKYLHEELRRQETGGDAAHSTTIFGGRSDAPAILIVVDKGHGVVDAFWFFFYSFNLGNSVFNIRFGNHIGDWEHSAVRFHHGKPQAVYFSEHNFGSAYSYEAVEKLGKRPVIYSAVGTHAMYPTAGLHPYVLPWGILHDETDKGPLWDPVLNSQTYTYDPASNALRASSLTPDAPRGWFYYAGHWGDKFYPLGDRRQYRFAGQYKYVNGPLGPRFKNLGRKKICGGPDSAPCVIKHWLGGMERVRRWETPAGEEADAFSATAQ